MDICFGKKERLFDILRSMSVVDDLLTKDVEGRIAGLNPKADDADAEAGAYDDAVR